MRNNVAKLKKKYQRKNSERNWELYAEKLKEYKSFCRSKKKESVKEWKQLVKDIAKLRKERREKKKKKDKKADMEVLSDTEKPDCPKLMCKRFEVGLILNRFFEFEHGWELTKDFITKYKKNLR